MTQINHPKILALGAHGMLGSTVYEYFKKNNTSVWATSREKIKNNYFTFDAYEYDKLEQIIEGIDGVDYVINCIGVLRNINKDKDYQYINAEFPHLLESLAEKKNFKLFHISTDAVFPANIKTAFEDTLPQPEDNYGKSKLLGETTSQNALTIRTSILGISQGKSTGLLNWITSTNEKEITGFTNQRWSGCTTLQFASFCLNIIESNSFQHLRKNSPFYHFVPILGTTKYEIIQTFVKELSLSIRIKASEGKSITRNLDTNYNDILSSYYQKQTIQTALHELALFENLLT